MDGCRDLEIQAACVRVASKFKPTKAVRDHLLKIARQAQALADSIPIDDPIQQHPGYDPDMPLLEGDDRDA